MSPDAAAAPPVLYGITKDPDVIGFLRAQTSSLRERIQDAIDNLQFNPRPPGHKTIILGGTEIIKIMVDEGKIKYFLQCIVKDEELKVFVIAIVEKRFSDMEIEHGK